MAPAIAARVHPEVAGIDWAPVWLRDWAWATPSRLLIEKDAISGALYNTVPARIVRSASRRLGSTRSRKRSNWGFVLIAGPRSLGDAPARPQNR